MQVILRTMKKYGIIVSDNGSNWFFQGTHDERWADDELHSLKSLYGRDFEVVDISSWMERPGFDSNSAAVPPASGISIPNIITHYKNYPNPFTQITAISYELNATILVTLKIHDLTGREIKTLVNGIQSAGPHSIEWDGTDTEGNRVRNGIYFCHISEEFGTSDSKKMIFLK
jgi:hypothetical protein